MKKFYSLIVVCVTVVLLAGIGAWVYVQKQNVAQKDRQAKSEQALEVKKLKYQECENNNRAAEASNKPFSDLFVTNCGLIL
ncbi:MAG TPA: hypothetical protein VHD60_03745 [Candidatus Saccharimonadales bacterium]|nr:hypothetical protein [Candidatus Saccharimonadales bacterium]